MQLKAYILGIDSGGRPTTHLFEECGTLEVVAWLAADWFMIYLTKQDGK
jgi:hypothetical protein